MKILMFIFMFLFIGAFFIISQNNLALKNSENVDKFAANYADWINSIIDNARGLAGYVIKLDWLPQNKSSE